MTELKRSRYFLVEIQDEEMADLAAFLRGNIVSSCTTQVTAVSLLTESRHVLSPAEMAVLAQVPAHRWTSREKLAADTGAAAETLDELAGKGLLVSNSEDPVLASLRQRDQSFSDNQWHPHVALYHAGIKHPTGLERADLGLLEMEKITESSPAGFEELVARHGKPPEVFHEVRGDGTSIALPRVERQGNLYEALARRRTVRAFDRDQPMRAEDIATLLYYVFGCHGTAELSENVTVQRRTSPSGGSLHPAEVYPLVLNAEGVDPGLYHYNARRHSLSRLSTMERSQAEDLATRLACGQTWGAEAHVLLLVSLRFSRNFWKYRENVKTHSIMLLDGGHLSQTFYLVCADLGLGAFFIALDCWLAEETLGLDGIREGAVALLGCGPPAEDGSDYGIDFSPYIPGETEI